MNKTLLLQKLFSKETFIINIITLFIMSFLFNLKLTIFVIIILAIQNPFVKIDILRLDLSGLFTGCNETKRLIQLLLYILLGYYILCSIN